MKTKNSARKAPKFPHRAKNSHANARFTPFIKYALRGFTEATRENFTDALRLLSSFFGTNVKETRNFRSSNRMEDLTVPRYKNSRNFFSLFLRNTRYW